MGVSVYWPLNILFLFVCMISNHRNCISAKEARQQKEQWEWRLEATRKGKGEGGGKTWKERGRQCRGVRNPLPTMFITHFLPLVSFYVFWKHQESSGCLTYFREYRKRPVPRNGSECFIHACSVTACFLVVNLHWFFQCTQEV